MYINIFLRTQKYLQKTGKHFLLSLRLEEMTPADIDDNAPMFGEEGLELDSTDVLELIVLLERNYGIKVVKDKFKLIKITI